MRDYSITRKEGEMYHAKVTDSYGNKYQNYFEFAHEANNWIYYIWEKEDYNPDNDPFMKNFDKDGNFIETTSETEVIEPQIESTSIKYIFKKSITKEKKDL